ncbi:MAG: hypothetical protein ABS46_02895 [Cytophagaceae bacterium SCN 52-12]|nr:MAG: hypothetical protein ABS46_02895 [Cytophagaceae bacterium SCN 52-12]
MLSLSRKILFSVFFLLICIELILRFGYGFCSAPLYIEDPDYEYIYAPNQTVRRFGNTIRTNSLSMRNDELSPSDSVTVLLIGDSVVNGGSLTDNAELASTLLEKRLSAELGKRVRVLNISAGSWGPDNSAAYLRKHGVFNAKAIGLVASSHDAYDIMTHAPQVGIDPNLPDKQFRIAIVELWSRYIYPIYFKNIRFNHVYYAPGEEAAAPAPEAETYVIRKDGDHFNPGFGELKNIAEEHHIPFFIYLHPEISEVEDGFYNDQGQAIVDYARQDSIRLIRELDIPPLPECYRKRDVVHYNAEGQKFLASHLFPLFYGYLKEQH